MSNYRETSSARIGWLTIGVILLFGLVFAACAPTAATPLPAPTAQQVALAPTSVPASATPVPTAVPPSATVAPTAVPPTETLAPTVPPTATDEPTVAATATVEATLEVSATETVAEAGPTLSIAMKATAAAEHKKAQSEQCLGCHGPYDKIIAASKNFVADSGETVNPHTTVDNTILKAHTSGKGMLDCVTCHVPHPQPLTSVKDIQRADVEYCYTQCHHQNNFTPCSACHDDYK